MAFGQVKRFPEYVPDFQQLSEQPALSYREQILPLLVQCSLSFDAVNESPEEVGRAARSIFLAVHNIFLKLGKGFNEEEQKVLLSFSIRAVTCVSNIPSDALKGLEAIAVTESLAMARLAEKLPPENAEDMTWEFVCTVVPLATELINLDLQKASFDEAAELCKQFMNLIIRHTALCGEQGFNFLCHAAGTSASKISSVPGKEAIIICHWEELLEAVSKTMEEKVASKAFFESREGCSGKSSVSPDAALSREKRAHIAAALAEGLCSQTVVERLAKVTSVLGNYLSRAHLCLTKGRAARVHAVFDALERIIEIRFRRGNPTPDEKKAILYFQNTALGGFCKMYPALLIERYERGATLDLELALTPKDAFQTSAIGLQHADPKVFPFEQFLGHYEKTLLFAFQSYTGIKVADLEQGIDSLLEAEARWHPEYPIDQISDVWSRILDEVRGNPLSSTKGLKSLFTLISGHLRWIKTYKKQVSEGEKKAFLEAADVFDKAVFEAARASGKKKKLDHEFRNKILSSLG